MIVVDTSVLIDALSGPRRSGPMLRAAIEAGERLLLPAWSSTNGSAARGSLEELDAQEALLPAERALLRAEEADLAAGLYEAVDEPRGREVDIAIAAHASEHGASVWTLNVTDFDDLPGVELYDP